MQVRIQFQAQHACVCVCVLVCVCVCVCACVWAGSRALEGSFSRGLGALFSSGPHCVIAKRHCGHLALTWYFLFITCSLWGENKSGSSQTDTCTAHPPNCLLWKKRGTFPPPSKGKKAEVLKVQNERAFQHLLSLCHPHQTLYKAVVPGSRTRNLIAWMHGKYFCGQSISGNTNARHYTHSSLSKTQWSDTCLRHCPSKWKIHVPVQKEDTGCVVEVWYC